jgi:integrase/recombinase XerD
VFENTAPVKITLSDLEHFIASAGIANMTNYSQARLISGIKAFFRYMIYESYMENNPADLLETPKLKRMLPDVLSVEEISKMIDCIDLSHPHGDRDKAMIEILYGCGLRVSELITLRINDLYLNDGFIRVIGKGNKERLVPVGALSIEAVTTYLAHHRKHMQAQKGSQEILFLNHRNKRLSRAAIFDLIKKLAWQAGIKKNISPHSLRHSFATHLMEGGANIRSIQDMLGHASISTTEIYTHLDRSFLTETLEQYHPRYGNVR